MRGGALRRGFDFNGDGIGDELVETQVILAGGGGFSLPNADCVDDGRGCVFADANGDGLTDLIGHNAAETLYVSLSTGSSFAALQSIPNINGDEDAITAGDVNGDGRAELILAVPGASGIDGVSSFVVTIGDNAAQAHPGWTVTARSAEEVPLGGRIGDFNGDGVTDIVAYRSGQYSLANGPVDNLLTSATNGYGAQIDVAYTPSSAWANNRMPSVEQTVSSVVVRDGRGGIATTTYSYALGAYNFPERRFLGFEQETEFLPCIAGEAPPACPKIARRYSQDLAAIGELEAETVYSGSGSIIGQRSWIYTVNDGPALPFTALPRDLITYRYRAAGGGTPLAIRTLLQRDVYANITSQQFRGREDVSGDERTVLTTFFPNTSAYIVSLPAVESTYAGLTSADPLLAQEFYHYDGAAAHTTAPVEGDLTRRRVRVNPTTLAAENFEYDLYGNRTAATDPVNNRTAWTFDASFHLYPTSETNALGQTRSTTWNFPCGLPATETDLNALQTITTYDVFCRPTLVDRPSTGASEAFLYLDFGNAASQRVRTGRPHPNGGTLYAWQYFDGLGRIWRDLRSGTANIRVDRGFDARGNRASETHPAYSADAGYATLFRYDGLNRLILQTNPDATTRSFVHDIDARTSAGSSVPLTKVTTTDELSRQSIVVSDAYERAIELTRFLGATPAVEQRRYDRLGRLTGLTDPGGSVWSYTYDMRGLRLSASDPDLGAWSYGYDLAGRMIEQTDARGVATTLSYDGLGRVLEKRVGSGPFVDVTSNVYDEVRAGFRNIGRLTSAATRQEDPVITPGASQSFDHDGEGRFARETWVVDGVTHAATTAYAPGGEALWRTFPDGDSVGSTANRWSYDLAGRLFSVPGVVTDTQYEADGQTAAISYANGVSTTFAYSPERRWLNVIETRGPMDASGAAPLLQSLAYSRDDAGRITAVASNRARESWSYGYDTLDQLTLADNLTDNSLDQSFTYAANGNMSSNSALGKLHLSPLQRPAPACDAHRRRHVLQL